MPSSLLCSVRDTIGLMRADLILAASAPVVPGAVAHASSPVTATTIKTIKTT
jgi:hypothetical protein